MIDIDITYDEGLPRRQLVLSNLGRIESMGLKYLVLEIGQLHLQKCEMLFVIQSHFESPILWSYQSVIQNFPKFEVCRIEYVDRSFP